jgi:hypothetical protein
MGGYLQGSSSKGRKVEKKKEEEKKTILFSEFFAGTCGGNNVGLYKIGVEKLVDWKMLTEKR